MKSLNLCFVGFGNVNRALVKLLRRKEADLRGRNGIEWKITGISSRRIGWLADANGFNADELCGAETPVRGRSTQLFSDIREWLKAAQADVMFEASSLNPETGQPAIGYIRAALQHGAHAITANKGPIVHGYRELRDLAAERGKRFLFESTVMDGAPIFSLFRETLPAVEVKSFKGILNSTTNFILTAMEQGEIFEAAVRKAQEMGIAETDPSNDVDGWDATVKVAALVNVVMGVPLRPGEVEREGIGKLSGEAVRAAQAAGTPYKLVCRGQRTVSGVKASVRPEQVPLSDPLALVSGTSSAVQFETDVLPGLTITEGNPSVETTAYGMLADMIRAVAL